MGKRPRIKTSENLINKKTEVSSIPTNSFTQNCASKNAKIIHTYNDFSIEVWIDKHYEIRSTKGDENGLRAGIEQRTVINLVIESVKYIFHFYMITRLPNLINFFNKEKPTKHRLVIRDFCGIEEPLNIVIEIHFLDYSKYEITVITAMKCKDFMMSDGQIFMSLTDTTINLNRLVKKNVTSISNIPR